MERIQDLVSSRYTGLPEPRIEREIIMLLDASVTEASDPPLNY